MKEIEKAVSTRLLQSFKRYLNLTWDNFNDFRVEMRIIDEEFLRDTLGMPEDEKLKYGIFHVFNKPFDPHQMKASEVHRLLGKALFEDSLPLMKDSKWLGSKFTGDDSSSERFSAYEFQDHLVDRILLFNSLNMVKKTSIDFWRSTLLDDSDFIDLLPEISNQRFYFLNRFASDRSYEIFFSFLNPIEVFQQGRYYHSTRGIVTPERSWRNYGIIDTYYWMNNYFETWISDIFQKVLEMHDEKQPKKDMVELSISTPKMYYESVDNFCYSRESDDDSTVLFSIELDQCVHSLRIEPHLMFNYYVPQGDSYQRQSIVSIETKIDTNFTEIIETFFKDLRDGSELVFDSTAETSQKKEEEEEEEEDEAYYDEDDYYTRFKEFTALERFKRYVHEGTMYARIEAIPFFILTNGDKLLLFQTRKFKKKMTGSVEDVIKAGLFDEWDVSYMSLQDSPVPWIIHLTSALLDMHDYMKAGITLEKSVIRNYYLTIGASKLKKQLDKLKYQITRKAFVAIFQKTIGDENRKILDIEKLEIPHGLEKVETKIDDSLKLFIEQSKPVWDGDVIDNFLFDAKLSTTFKIKRIISNELWHTEQAAVTMVAVSGLNTAVLKLYSPTRAISSKKTYVIIEDGSDYNVPSFGRNLKVMMQYYFINEVWAYKALSGTGYVPQLINVGYVYMDEVDDAGSVDIYEDPFKVGDGKLQNVKADCPYLFIEDIKSVPVSELNDEERDSLKKQAFADLEDMHSKGIYHRDIETRNLLIKKTEAIEGFNYRLVFIDFGESCKKHSNEKVEIPKPHGYYNGLSIENLAKKDKSDLTNALELLFKKEK